MNIELNINQIKLLRDIGKPFAAGLSFANVRISPTGGALCDWTDGSEIWTRLNELMVLGTETVEINREELKIFIEWMDRREKQQMEFRALTGDYKPRTRQEEDLYMYLKLVQAFNFYSDING